MKSLKRWIAARLDLFFIASCLIVFCLGIAGFRIQVDGAGQHRPWMDCAYFSLRLFGFEYDAPDRPISWYLEVARWMAPFTVLGSVFHFARSFFAREKCRMQASRKRLHTVVCGLGSRGHWICRAFLNAEGATHKLVAIELDAGSRVLGDLQSRGLTVIEGSATDLLNLEAAGLQKASRVVLATGCDTTNLAIAREIIQEHPTLHRKVEIIAAVESYETRSLIADNVTNLGVTLMSFREQAALWLARDLAIHWIQTLRELPSAPVLLVESDQDLRDELVRALGMLFQVSSDQRPTLHLCSTSEQDRIRFEELFPEAWRCLDLKWHPMSAERAVPSGCAPPDLAIFTSSNDSKAVEAARRFLQRRPNLSTDRVIACVEDPEDLIRFYCSSDGSSRWPTIRNIYQQKPELHGFIGHAKEFEGKELHEAYRSESREKAEAQGQPWQDPGPWESLSDFRKNSNRLAAMHGDIKKAFWSHLQPVCPRDAILKRLTESEHARWMAFHTLSGWRFSGCLLSAEDRAVHRVHPCIRPFNELSELEIRKDYLCVMTSLGLPV